jgi:transglutaminase-like putative cysteine protease
MIYRSFWNRARLGRLIPKALLLAWYVAGVLSGAPLLAAHNQAPDWMHALVNSPLPPHDEKTNAVELYYDENLTVISADKFRDTIRAAYKILRPEGRRYGTVRVLYDSATEKVSGLRAWCIPADGKDYEVTDKEALDVSPLKEESLLVSDMRWKELEIPAPVPGNIVGYEYITERRPLVLQDYWFIQSNIPVKTSRYSLTLPPGWEFKNAWSNYLEQKTEQTGGGQCQWTASDVPEIRDEPDMPPWAGLAGRMVVTLFPPGGAAANSFPTWHDLGLWQARLIDGRRNASPEIKEQVSQLIVRRPAQLAQMRALAAFVQQEIRYVAIELGIGGYQPHPAEEIFAHRYGDCKDKVNLLNAMLHEIGVESYDVIINDERGSVTPATPAHLGFNHVITAIRLPAGTADPALIATLQHPALGTLLFFDPTNPEVPLGRLPGYLQASYGLLIAPGGGELIAMPQQPPAMSGIRRTAKLTLSASGTLAGDVLEMRVGDAGAAGRALFQSTEKASDQIKPIEVLLADSLSTYQITRANIANLKEKDEPFIWEYTFNAPGYAKPAGDLLLVRPRVLGRKARALLETPEPRRYPIEFDGPDQDTDDFEITLPAGYVPDDLPPAIDADIGCASYHAKTEVAGNVLHYHRTFEIKQLSVPASEAEKLKRFYRMIASDERNTAVLKRVSP